MSTNILKCIINLSNYSDFTINSQPKEKSGTRINKQGDALEYFIKGSFCNTFNNFNKNSELTKTYFSYQGNANNPPDFILRDSDAYEVKQKKIENNQFESAFKSDIALNSSYPKNFLFSNDKRISKKCKECENWQKKDIFYVIGYLFKKNSKLKALHFMHGLCYAASKQTYLKISDTISQTIRSMDIEVAETMELGRFNKIDHLNRSNLRVRGMYNIHSPYKILLNSGISKKDLFSENTINILACMTEEKFNSYPKEDKINIFNNRNITTKKIKLPSPDNININIDCILIKLDIR